MLRVFYADLRNTLHNRGFLGCCFAMAGYMLFSAILLWVVLHIFLKDGALNGEDVLDSYDSLAGFVITGASLAVFSGDYTSGIVRNKIISGAKRRNIAISAITCGALIGALLCIIYVITGVVLVPFFTEGLRILRVSEAADAFLVFTLASMAVGAFSTMQVLVLGGSKVSYVVGLLTAFFLKIANIEVCEKLYPEKGLCTLQGAKLVLYRAFDRFVPYSHFSLMTRWKFTDYLIGSLSLIVISYFIGIVLFQKKEIK